MHSGDRRASDTLSGVAGSDLIGGGYGSDVLGGGSGDDDLRGGLIRNEGVDANTMDGGAGIDTCRRAFDAPVNCETVE